jgi:hypothetical protein
MPFVFSSSRPKDAPEVNIESPIAYSPHPVVWVLDGGLSVSLITLFDETRYVLGD